MEMNKFQASAVLPLHKSSLCPHIEEERGRSTQKKQCLLPTAPTSRKVAGSILNDFIKIFH